MYCTVSHCTTWEEQIHYYDGIMVSLCEKLTLTYLHHSALWVHTNDVVYMFQVFQRAHRFGSGLLQLGMKPSPDNFLGIYSNNRIEASVFPKFRKVPAHISVEGWLLLGQSCVTLQHFFALKLLIFPPNIILVTAMLVMYILAYDV